MLGSEAAGIREIGGSVISSAASPGVGDPEDPAERKDGRAAKGERSRPCQGLLKRRK